MAAKTLSILGSTGSVGRNTIEVIQNHPGQFRVAALTGNGNIDLLAEQAKILRPKMVVTANDNHFAELQSKLSGLGIKVGAGEAAMTEAASMPVDICVAAISGFAGLAPTMAALRAAKRLAFVSKECLVCAGDLFLVEAAKNNCEIIPTDSEHSAIFQLLHGQDTAHIDSITLTASGGPFWSWPLDKMRHITPDQASAHPIWRMGKKISIDSATLFNKGLEIIEAHYLFQLPSDKIQVLIHPEGIMHAMVNLTDGSILAHMGTPDMKIPIAYALFYPDRIQNPASRLDWTKMGPLQFKAPDDHRFPSISLARRCLQQKGMAALAYNAANEVAVSRFLSQDIEFINIFSLVADVLDSAAANRGFAQTASNLKDLVEFDRLIRQMAKDWHPRSSIRSQAG